MVAATAPAHFQRRVDAVAEAAAAVPGVRALHGGDLVEAAVYLPGRRVSGIRMDDASCAVHIVVDWGADIRAIADGVREALRPLLDGRPVAVVVEDIGDPERTGADEGKRS